MGRFYQTDKPVFMDVRDLVYSPDYRTAAMIDLQKERDYNQTQNKVQEIFDNLKFNYLNSEADENTARGIKDYYQDRVNELASKIQADPLNYHKYKDEVRKLQRDIQNDRTNGAIANLEGSYNAYHQMLKNNEELCKAQPEMCEKLIADRWKTWGGNSMKNRFAGERLTKAIDQSKLVGDISKMVADLKNKSGAYTTKDGKYKVEVNGGIEYLTEDRLVQYVANKILSEPENVAYMKQSDRLGLSNYFDKNGDLKGSSWNSLLDAYKAYAYTREEKKINREEDKYGLRDDEDRRAKAKKLEEEKNNRFFYSVGASTFSPEEVKTKTGNLHNIMLHAGKDYNSLSEGSKNVFDKVIEKSFNDNIAWRNNKDKNDLLAKTLNTLNYLTPEQQKEKFGQVFYTDTSKYRYNDKGFFSQVDIEKLSPSMRDKLLKEVYKQEAIKQSSLLDNRGSWKGDDFTYGISDNSKVSNSPFGDIVVNSLNNYKKALSESRTDMTYMATQNKGDQDLLMRGLKIAESNGQNHIIVDNYTLYDSTGKLRNKSDKGSYDATGWNMSNSDLQSILHKKGVSLSSIAEKYKLPLEQAMNMEGQAIGTSILLPKHILIEENILEDDGDYGSLPSNIRLTTTMLDVSGSGQVKMEEAYNELPARKAVKESGFLPLQQQLSTRINLVKSGYEFTKQDEKMNVGINGMYIDNISVDKNIDGKDVIGAELFNRDGESIGILGSKSDSNNSENLIIELIQSIQQANNL